MSRYLPSLKPRQVLQALKRAGFAVHHVALAWKRSKTIDATSIIDQAGLTVEEFLDLL